MHDYHLANFHETRVSSATSRKKLRGNTTDGLVGGDATQMDMVSTQGVLVFTRQTTAIVWVILRGMTL